MVSRFRFPPGLALPPSLAFYEKRVKQGLRRPWRAARGRRAVAALEGIWFSEAGVASRGCFERPALKAEK